MIYMIKEDPYHPYTVVLLNDDPLRVVDRKTIEPNRSEPAGKPVIGYIMHLRSGHVEFEPVGEPDLRVGGVGKFISEAQKCGFGIIGHYHGLSVPYSGNVDNSPSASASNRLPILPSPAYLQ